MMPWQLFLVIPTPYCILQRLALIVCKKVPDISVVFKLPVNLRFAFSPICNYLEISANGIFISLSRIGFQPFLKRDIECESWTYMILEKCPVNFRADKSGLECSLSFLVLC